MLKKYAMSGMGFAIVIVIIFAVIMIVSAPTILDSSTKENEQKMSEQKILEQNDLLVKFQEFENQVNQRLGAIENNMYSSNENKQSNISNKYVCTIEGNVDENGNIVKINSRSGLTKFIFMCEYKP